MRFAIGLLADLAPRACRTTVDSLGTTTSGMRP